jgi:hypothetical protein
VTVSFRKVSLRTVGLALASLSLVLASGCNGGGEAEAGKAGYAAASAGENKGPTQAPLQAAKVVGADGKAVMPPAHGGGMPPGHGAPNGGGMPPGHGAPNGGGMPPGHGAPNGGMPPGHGEAGGDKLPPGHPPTGGGAPAGDPVGDGTVRGTIELGSGLADKIKPGSVLFIIVRRDAGEGAKGMLLASQKLPASAGLFPLKYVVSAKDVMMQGTQLSGAVRVDARIDGDGDAISKAEGDIVGAHSKVVNVGTHDVNFTLDQTL